MPLRRRAFKWFCLVFLLIFDLPNSAADMRDVRYGSHRTFQSSEHEGSAETTAHRIISASKQVYRILVQLDDTIRSGTVFLVSGKRVVATNSHVVANGTAYALGYVSERGQTEWVKLEVLATFPQKDLALLQAHADLPGDPFPLAADFPELTSDLYAIGFPAAADLGTNVDSPLARDTSFFTPSVVKGNVSRIIADSWTPYQLQHQTPISLGYSGGPLVNSRGVVVGVSSAIHKEANGIAYGVSARDLVGLISACALPQRITHLGGPAILSAAADAKQRQVFTGDPIIGRAYGMLKRGEIAQARSTFSYVVRNKASREAYEGLAKTYDPEVLKLLPVFGDLGDASKAQELYELAQRAGQPDRLPVNSVFGCMNDYCALREASVGGPVVGCGSAQSSASASRR